MARTSEGTQFGTPLRGKEMTRAARGRLCDQDGCLTVLSTYNPSSSCFLHLTPAFRRPLDRA
jgi:hypothetical protein